MKRRTKMFLPDDLAGAEAFRDALPRSAEAVLTEVKNTEDYRLGCTTAECRTLWFHVHYWGDD